MLARGALCVSAILIFTELFPARFRRINHDTITAGSSVSRIDSVTSRHTLFSYPVVNNYLSRSSNVQVKNAVALKKKNR